MLLEPHRLRTPAMITRIEYAQSLDSTNDAARRLAGDVPHGSGMLVIAEQQTAGRGRGANKWWTGSGSLALSILFDPTRYGIEMRYSGMVPLAAALAIVDVVTRRLGQPSVGIHWPNDVFIGPKKLAGILVEALGDGRQIVGIGLNVNNSTSAAPAEVSQLATSLLDELGAPLDRTDLLGELLEAIDVYLMALGAERERVAAEADEVCLQKGAPLTIAAGDERTTGLCEGIGDDGALLLETPAGRKTIYSGVVLKNVT
ncbi:MAG: biotin--[acetyl-CoA-carboxylase] ligase [Pirellulales bacterium]